MKLSLIAAVSDDNVIGINNTLPWHLPEDLKFFKLHTTGKPVIMGRKTFESLGRPLPGRLNIVISGNADFKVPEDVVLSNNFGEVITKLQQDGTEEAFVIGGGVLFETCMPFIETLYITRVHGHFLEGNVFFPAIDHSHWKLVWEERHEPDSKHQYAFTFQQFERMEM
jgi:dihydrofolate reductase